MLRRGWDSNPCALADKRFSRPPRYDLFDTSAYHGYLHVPSYCIKLSIICQVQMFRRSAVKISKAACNSETVFYRQILKIFLASSLASSVQQPAALFVSLIFLYSAILVSIQMIITTAAITLIPNETAHMLRSSTMPL